MREIHFKDYGPIGIKDTVPCHIRFIDPYFGYLDDKAYYLAGKMPFQSACYRADAGRLYDSAPVRHDHQEDGWALHFDNALKPWTNGGSITLTPGQVRSIVNSIHVYTVRALNSQGFAYTTDDWTGDERGRRRYLDYCLFRDMTALCGHGEVGYVADGPKGDLTPYVLGILRSVEFLADAPVAAALESASAPASAASR